MTDDLPDHTNYSLIKATDESGNVVTVLVDASGRMYAVMTGDYAGALKTLAVDDQGRIQAVLTDPEDVFGNPSYMGAGELAVRLGSIYRYEKRGNVIWQDDFEASVLRWQSSGNGVGNAVALNQTRMLSGIQSAKLTGGSDGSKYARIERYLHYPTSTRIGFLVNFALDTATPTLEDYIVFGFIIYTGTHQYLAQVRYDHNNDTIEVYNHDGNWHTVDSTPLFYLSSYVFHPLKFVIDWSTKKYVRLYLEDTEYDLSSYSMRSSASSVRRFMGLSITVYSNAGKNGIVYIDDVVITQNEV